MSSRHPDVNHPAVARSTSTSSLNQAARSRSSSTIVRCSTPRQMTWYQAGLGSCGARDPDGSGADASEPSGRPSRAKPSATQGRRPRDCPWDRPSRTSRRAARHALSADSTRARAARLPLRVPDPRAHDVPDQPLARRDARGGRGAAGRVRAHVARARHPRLGRGLVGAAADGRRPDRPDRRRAAGHDRACTRTSRSPRRSSSPASSRRRAAEPGRLRARQLPVASATCTRRSRDLEVVVCEDDDEIVAAIDERTLLVPISHVLFKSAEIQDVERDRPARARGRRARRPRRVPVGRDRPARRDRARRRLRRRRLGQVALRRPGQRLALRPARPRRAARAGRTPAGRRTRRRSPSRRRCATPTAPRAS